jgi:hypothetical protein
MPVVTEYSLYRRDDQQIVRKMYEDTTLPAFRTWLLKGTKNLIQDGQDPIWVFNP